MKWTERIRQAWASRKAHRQTGKNVGWTPKQKHKAKPYRRTK